MADDRQPFDPPADLLAIARTVTGPWVRRSIEAAARRGGVRPDDLDHHDLDVTVARTTDRIVTQLEQLLALDVDDQRTNPLSIYRRATGEPTEYLRRNAVPQPHADRFAADRFPDDPYLLGPATWADVDDRLHGPGLVWGAWKAKLVLDRRRSEGMR